MDKTSTPVELLDSSKRAIAFAGGPAALARHMRSQGQTITTQAISQWKRVPSKRVLGVEKAAAFKITKYQMRPDIYGWAA